MKTSRSSSAAIDTEPRPIGRPGSQAIPDKHHSLRVVRVLPSQTVTTLSAPEVGQLEKCEAVLARGLATFFEVGVALLTIRESRLYRATHKSFDTYCGERWGIGRSYASRVIGAAERLKLLPQDASLPRPANEFQMRPFLQVDPADFPKMWERTVKQAEGGRVTAQHILNVLGDRKPTTPRAVLKGTEKPSTKERANVDALLGLIRQAKEGVDNGSPEEVREILNKLEDVVRGM